MYYGLGVALEDAEGVFVGVGVGFLGVALALADAVGLGVAVGLSSPGSFKPTRAWGVAEGLEEGWTSSGVGV